MAISTSVTFTRLLETTAADQKLFTRKKILKCLSCIDFDMRQKCMFLPSKQCTKKNVFLYSSVTSSTQLAYGYNGRKRQKGWKSPMNCARQTDQEKPKIIEQEGRDGNTEHQTYNLSGNKEANAGPIHLQRSRKATITEKAEKIVDLAVNFIASAGELKDETTGDEVTKQKAMAFKTVVFWVCSAVVFGSVIGLKDGTSKASEFFAGYLLEQSLSVDNLFVFILIFKYFKVPLMYQTRVLSYGIAGAIIFRASMILLGAATLQRFEVVNLFLAGILLYSSSKLFIEADDEEEDLSNNFIVKLCKSFIPVTPTYDGDRFITVVEGAQKATPLLLTVAVVELSDIAFAVDSIPAVFGVTKDPFTVLSSNMFAILGLRSLYTLISGSMSELEYLQPAVGVVLGFIGCKMIADFFGYHTPTEVSLGVVATILGMGVTLSLLPSSGDEK